MTLRIAWPSNRAILTALAFLAFNLPLQAWQSGPRMQSDSAGHTTVSIYDSSGQLMFVTDSDGNKRTPAGTLVVLAKPEAKSRAKSAKPQTLGATINVPADHSTIQDAINAASNGDTVLVADGTYREVIDFNGKDITVTSVNGAATTIINGAGSNSVVTFNTGETSAAVLNGFTITDGFSSFSNPSFGDGGGIFIAGASPTITNNVITDNQACEGPGVFINGGGAVLQGNVISNNSAAGCSGGIGGGGIAVLANSTPQILNNVITNNSMTISGINGGGISLFASGNIVIQDNVISGNTMLGIAMVNGSVPQMIQNLIINNTGGGLSTSASGTGMIFLNNTFGNNMAQSSFVAGFGSASAVGGSFPSDAIIQNNLMIAQAGEEAIFCNTVTLPVGFAANDVFSSGAAAYDSDCGTPPTGLSGNISADPLYVDPAAGDFHVQPGSPAINAGSTTGVTLPATDLEGNPRTSNGKVDLGAYEFQGNTTSSFSSASLTFSQQQIATTSPVQTVTINNTGAIALHITTFTVSGDFAETDNCHGSSGVASGKSCTISFTFTPTIPGLRTGQLVVTSNTAAGPVTIQLSGSAVGPVINLSLSSLSFSNQLVNTASTMQSFTVSNSGNGALTFTGIVATGDFAQTNNCGASVAAGGRCTVNVIFMPTVSGTRTGAVTITDNAIGSPHTVSLQGNATDFALGEQVPGATSATVTAGGMAAYNLLAGGTPGASGTVNLSCSGAPSLATCTVTPTAVTLNGTTVVNFSVTVSTTARSSVVPTAPRSIPPPPLGVLLWVLMGLLAVLPLAGLRNVQKKLRYAGITAVIVTLLLLVGCGGSGTPPTPQPGTPSGTFALTVTASAGTDVKTLNLTLTVN